jgi:hypothetical protein
MFGFAVKTVGLAAETVVSMGGLKVMPDLPLSTFVPESAYILILPGGESWTERYLRFLKWCGPWSL